MFIIVNFEVFLEFGFSILDYKVIYKYIFGMLFESEFFDFGKLGIRCFIEIDII